ncbi:unnamed protein product, partial [Clonostachys rhizophaga]
MNDQELQIPNTESVDSTTTPVSPPASTLIDHHANSDDQVLIHGLSETLATHPEDITPMHDNVSPQQISKIAKLATLYYAEHSGRVLGDSFKSSSFSPSIYGNNYPVRSVAVQGEANTGIAQSIFYPENAIKRDDVTRVINLATSLDTSGNFSTPIGINGASCSTGNCTFETYSSLGVCLKVANISSELRIEQVQDNEPLGIPLLDEGFGYGPLLSPGGRIWKVSLPGGPALAGLYGFSMVVDALNGNKSIGFQTSSDLIRTRLVSVVLIFTKPVLSNLSLVDPIPKDLRILINATTVFNLDCNSILDDVPLTCLPREERMNETLYLIPPYLNAEGVNASVGDKTFGIDYYSMESMAEAMARQLQCYQGVSDSPSEDPSLIAYGQLFGSQLFTRALFAPDGQFNHIGQGFIHLFFVNHNGNISMRTAPPPDSNIKFMNFTGQAWRDESYVLINWGWISFLACEVLISASFLLLTIMSQSLQQRRYHGKSPLLYEDSKDSSRKRKRIEFNNNEAARARQLNTMNTKDSSLATLVALSSRCRDMVGGGLRPLDELEIAAKGLQVKLDGNEIAPAEAC